MPEVTDLRTAYELEEISKVSCSLLNISEDLMVIDEPEIRP
jgi:hypothetical protein